jgi:hypothetical protein
MKEVEENTKAAKVTGKSISSGQLFNTPSPQPTVGAGGQYGVQVQKPEEGGFTKLARGLSAFNTALGAIAENDVAQEELAAKRDSELSLEESERLFRKAQEDEDSFFEGGSFIDRLVRRGEASAQSNPYFYSRGKRAYGIRTAEQKYTVAVSKDIHDAQQAYRKDPNKTYSVVDIQNATAQRIKDEYGISDTASSESGFNQVASKLNGSQIIRDVEAQDKITRSHSIINKADEISSIIIGSELMTTEDVIKSLSRADSVDNSLAARDVAMSFKLALSKSMDRNPVETKRIIDMQDEGKFADLKLGGYSLSSTVYEEAFDYGNSLYEKWEKDTERKNDVNESKIGSDVKMALKSINALDFNEPQSLTSILGDDANLPQEMADATYSTPEDMLEAMKDHMLSKYDMHRSVVLSTYSDFDSSQDNRISIDKQKKLNEFGDLIRSASGNLSVDDQLIETRQEDKLQSPEDMGEVARIRQEYINDVKTLVMTGRDSEGQDILINDIPWRELSDSAEDNALKLDYVTNLGRKSQKEQRDFIDSKVAKSNLRSIEDAMIDDNSGESDKDKIKNAYKELKPEKIERFVPKEEYDNLNKVLWTSAKAKSNTEDDLFSDKQLRNPNNRRNLSKAIASLQESKNKSYYARSGLSFASGVRKMEPEEIEKANAEGKFLLQRRGVTMDELRTLDNGRIVIDGKVIIVTDEILSGTPLVGDVVDEDFKEATNIINNEFSGSIQTGNMRDSYLLNKSILNYKASK